MVNNMSKTLNEMIEEYNMKEVRISTIKKQLENNEQVLKETIDGGRENFRQIMAEKGTPIVENILSMAIDTIAQTHKNCGYNQIAEVIDTFLGAKLIDYRDICDAHDINNIEEGYIINVLKDNPKLGDAIDCLEGMRLSHKFELNKGGFNGTFMIQAEFPIYDDASNFVIVKFPFDMANQIETGCWGLNSVKQPTVIYNSDLGVDKNDVIPCAENFIDLLTINEKCLEPICKQYMLDAIAGLDKEIKGKEDELDRLLSDIDYANRLSSKDDDYER